MIAIAQLEQTVEGFLREMDLLNEGERAHLKMLRFGSAVVMLSLHEKEDQALCRFTSIVLKECTPTPQLLEMILELNQEVQMGSFLLFDDRTLAFAASIASETLTLERFQNALNYVAQVADDYDDPLQQVAGGLRAQDLLEQTEL